MLLPALSKAVVEAEVEVLELVVFEEDFLARFFFPGLTVVVVAVD